MAEQAIHTSIDSNFAVLGLASELSVLLLLLLLVCLVRGVPVTLCPRARTLSASLVLLPVGPSVQRRTSVYLVA